jgi:hypothetical protein
MSSSEELTPWPDLDEEDDQGVGGKYNKEEEQIISSYYYNLNKQIFNFMGCNAKKGQLLITCENLLRLMAELLLDYEPRVKALPGGHLTDNNLISAKLYKSLKEPFLHCKMVKLYPHLYDKKRYGEFVLKEVDEDGDKLPKLLRMGEKDELIHPVTLVALARNMKTKDILEKVVSDIKKKMNDEGEGLKLFFMKKESSKLSKTESKPFEKLESPVYSGSRKKKKKPTKKKKKPTKRKKKPTKKKKKK